MMDIIKVKYHGYNIGDTETVNYRNIENLEFPIKLICNEKGSYIKFDFKYKNLNIDTSLTHQIDGLTDGEDTWSEYGEFSVNVSQKIQVSNRLLITGHISKIQFNIERIDNFSFLIITNNNDFINKIDKSESYWYAYSMFVYSVIDRKIDNN